MRGLRSTQRLGSVAGKLKEEDEFSLEDVYDMQPSSNNSLFNDYGYSDEEEDHDAKISFKIQNSLYLDDISGDKQQDISGDKQEKKMIAKKQKKQPPPSGALEALLCPSPPAMTPKKQTSKRSSKSKSNNSLSSSSDHVDKEKRKKAAKSSSDGRRDSKSKATPSRTQSFHSSFEVNDSDYETDIDDDEDLEFGSDSKEVSSVRSSLVEKALSTNRSSIKRSLSKKRLVDAFSISNNRKGREEVSDKGPLYSMKRSLSKKRMMDALSLSSHKDRTEVTPPRTRRANTKKGFLEGCSTSDHPPKRASAKLPSSRSRGLDDSTHSTRSSSKPRMPKSKSYDGLSPVRRKKSGSSKPRAPQNATFGDIEKSQRSASSVGRKKKSGLDYAVHSERSSSVPRKKKDLDRSNHSTTPKRSSSVKGRRKKDQLDRSPQLSERGRRSSSKSRVSDGDSGFLSPESTKSKGRRVPIKKPYNDEEEMTSRKLNNQSLSSSEHGRSKRSSRAGKDGDKDKATRKATRRNSNVE